MEYFCFKKHTDAGPLLHLIKEKNKYAGNAQINLI
jgi:hypothetical protein